MAATKLEKLGRLYEIQAQVFADTESSVQFNNLVSDDESSLAAAFWELADELLQQSQPKNSHVETLLKRAQILVSISLSVEADILIGRFREYQNFGRKHKVSIVETVADYHDYCVRFKKLAVLAEALDTSVVTPIEFIWKVHVLLAQCYRDIENAMPLWRICVYRSKKRRVML